MKRRQTEKKTKKTKSEWCSTASAGDIARAIFAPRKIFQAADDALSHDTLIFLESLLNCGDLAIVKGYFGKLVIMDETAFTSFTEAHCAD